MPDPEKGVKDDTTGTPPVDTGVQDTGTPPEETFEGEIKGEGDIRFLPVDAHVKARKAWQEKEAEYQAELEKLRNPPEEPIPDFDWEALGLTEPASPPQPTIQPNNQNPNYGTPPTDPNEQYREFYEQNPLQATAMVFGTMMQNYMQNYERQKSQARKFVPDSDKLDIDSVSDREMRAVASNPYALKALIAKSKMKVTPTPPPTQSGNGGNGNGVNPQDLIDQGRKEALSTVQKMAGATGEGTGGITSSAPTDTWELSEDQKAYYKGRGYSDEQIQKEIIPRLVEKKRQRGERL